MIARALQMFSGPMRLPLWVHICLTAMVVVGFRFIEAQLSALYEASRHPVDFMTGQTGFDATLVKGYYAHMDAFDTLPIYVQTQRFDFAFIAAMVAMGVLFGTLVARLSLPDTLGRALGLLGGAIIVFGALMDAAENVVSFVMLANPQNFADWLAQVYSSFAVTKFASITLGMALLVTGFVLGAIGLVRDIFTRKT